MMTPLNVISLKLSPHNIPLKIEHSVKPRIAFVMETLLIYCLSGCFNLLSLVFRRRQHAQAEIRLFFVVIEKERRSCCK